MKNRFWLVVGCAFLLSGCASLMGGEDNTPDPHALSPITQTVPVHQTWQQSIGPGVGDTFVKLQVKEVGNILYTADPTGLVSAVNQKTGALIWQQPVKAQLIGGPGVDSKTVVVTGANADVIALNARDGSVLWRVHASNQAFAAPTLAHGLVLVNTIDGMLTAYRATTGKQVWEYDHTVPSLILRGGSTPEVSGQNVFVGFADGKLVKLALKTGKVLWSRPLAEASGSSALERMIDIDVSPVITGGIVFAATYQGHIAAIDAASGDLIWSHDLSSYTGLAVDQSAVYISDADSIVWAFERNSGHILWKQPNLLHRGVSAPLIDETHVVVADLEGYLHWLAPQDGHFEARIYVDDSGLLATPVATKMGLVALTRGGELAAFRIG